MKTFGTRLKALVLATLAAALTLANSFGVWALITMVADAFMQADKEPVAAILGVIYIPLLAFIISGLAGVFFYGLGIGVLGPVLWWAHYRLGKRSKASFMVSGGLASLVGAALYMPREAQELSSLILVAGLSGVVAGWVIWTHDRHL